MIFTRPQSCEDCHDEFIGADFEERCRYCRRTYQLERIADAIETWLGWQ